MELRVKMLQDHLGFQQTKPCELLLGSFVLKKFRRNLRNEVSQSFEMYFAIKWPLQRFYVIVSVTSLVQNLVKWRIFKVTPVCLFRVSLNFN